MGKLSIRDEGVNDLAETLAEMLGVNKTEAVRQASYRLGELIGRVAPDDYLDEIFASFCIGK